MCIFPYDIIHYFRPSWFYSLLWFRKLYFIDTSRLHCICQSAVLSNYLMDISKLLCPWIYLPTYLLCPVQSLFKQWCKSELWVPLLALESSPPSTCESCQFHLFTFLFSSIPSSLSSLTFIASQLDHCNSLLIMISTNFGLTHLLPILGPKGPCLIANLIMKFSIFNPPTWAIHGHISPCFPSTSNYRVNLTERRYFSECVITITFLPEISSSSFYTWQSLPHSL